MDGEGNFLSLNYNEYTKYNSNTHKSEFKVKHPNWITLDVDNESKVYEDPYSMTLKNKIRVSAAENQLVSIDLKGGIQFWNLE